MDGLAQGRQAQECQEQTLEEKHAGKLGGRGAGGADWESSMRMGQSSGQEKGEETFKKEMTNSSPWGRMSDKIWFGN